MSTTMVSATTEATTKEGVEIKGKDVIKLNAPEILPPEGQLLTEAQDIVGAINELKKDLDEGGGGESDKWVRPSDWPVMPEPADNQIIMLISTQWDNSTNFKTAPYMQFKIYGYQLNKTSTNFDGKTTANVDWGDGYSETIELPSTETTVSLEHFFYDYDETGKPISWHDGPILDSGAHVFVVTITLPDTVWIDVVDSKSYPLEFYIGKKVKFYGSILSKEYLLEHVKLFGWQPTEENSTSTGTTGLFNSCYTLQCVDTTESLAHLPQRAFNACYNLREIDLSQCNEIGAQALAATMIPSLKSEALQTLGDYAIMNNHAITSLDTPNLSSVGQSALSGCLNIESITHTEDWTYSSGAFSSLYRWYDNPEKQHPQIP